MKITLKDGTSIELVPACRKVRNESGPATLVEMDDKFAIPGGKIATAGQVVSWAKERGARVDIFSRARP